VRSCAITLTDPTWAITAATSAREIIGGDVESSASSWPTSSALALGAPSLSPHGLTTVLPTPDAPRNAAGMARTTKIVHENRTQTHERVGRSLGVERRRLRARGGREGRESPRRAYHLPH